MTQTPIALQNKCVRLNGGSGCTYCKLEHNLAQRIRSFISHGTRNGITQKWNTHYPRKRITNLSKAK